MLLRVLLEVRVVGVLNEPLLQDAGLLAGEVRLLDTFLIDFSLSTMSVLGSLGAVAVRLRGTFWIEWLPISLM